MRGFGVPAMRRAAGHCPAGQRKAARVFGIDPKTVAKMLRFAVPPGYRRSKPPVRPKLDRLLPGAMPEFG